MDTITTLGLALVSQCAPPSEISIFKGEVKGKIVWPPKGNNGFGYDPFFVPSNSNKTFGEMLHMKKIFMDHRFKAFKKMAKFHLTDS